MLGICKMHEECKVLCCWKRLKGRKHLQDRGVGSVIVIKENPREIWCGYGLGFVVQDRIQWQACIKVKN